jgi:hypothetical protein
MTEIGAALAVLCDMPFWDAGRAVEIKKFAFGNERILPNRGNRLAGEWELHIQCAWRITQKNTFIMGSTDIYAIARDGQKQSWDEPGGNQCDLRSMELFSGPKLFVVSVEAQRFGGVVIRITNDVELEIWPSSWHGEQWRLFVPGTTERHFVVDISEGVMKMEWE